jgi:two-component system response regulator AtoC
MLDSGTTRKTILIGEDDREIRNYLEVTLRCRDYDVQSAVDGEGVMRYLRTGRPVSAVLLDIIMPNKDGFETLREIRETHADLPVIMLSGMFSPLNVVQAMKIGATDFLPKPVGHEDLNRMIRQVLDGAPPSKALPASRPEADDDMFFGVNPRMQSLRESLPKVAASDVPVLIQGETGTGKEVLARQVHNLSPRADKPFFKLNCAAVPADLMESELFGYERGAFTGAFQRKPGVFELAAGGTILLDEIGDMDIKLQSKLLQVLQSHEFRRVGGRDTISVDVRVIAATHRDLFEAIHNHKFREDLYYRLNVLTLTLPPLRERPEDILSIVEFLIRRHASRESPGIQLTPRLKEVFLAFDWPGNIRQMENVVRKLMVLRDPDVIVQELNTLRVRRQEFLRSAQKSQEETATVQVKAPTADLSSILDQVTRSKQDAEAAAILEALHETRWNRKQAAARLNIDYKALLYKMKKLPLGQRGPSKLDDIAPSEPVT